MRLNLQTTNNENTNETRQLRVYQQWLSATPSSFSSGVGWYQDVGPRIFSNLLHPQGECPPLEGQVRRLQSTAYAENEKMAEKSNGESLQAPSKWKTVDPSLVQGNWSWMVQNHAHNCMVTACGHSSRKQDGHHHISFYVLQLFQRAVNTKHSYSYEMTHLDRNYTRQLWVPSWMAVLCLFLEQSPNACAVELVVQKPV